MSSTVTNVFTLFVSAPIHVNTSLRGLARAEPVKNVVIVHGAFADGSGWERVADILGKDGYTVSVVQEPLTSLADDVAATNRMLDLQQGPTLLVGHSYGGVVITEAGNASNVVGLVYIAAFIPDQGESAVSLLSSAPAANNDMRATQDDFLYLDPAAWHHKKSWALVATRDHNINPDLERKMAKRAGSQTIEVPASHAVYVSKPRDVASLIEQAAKASAQ